jgi:hypothetical protein
VTKEDYEVQRMSSSQKALEDLLEEIVNDRTMTALKRKQRLKKVEFRGHMFFMASLVILLLTVH